MCSRGSAETAAPAELSVYGRRLFVPQAMGNTCRFTFAQLCEEPLGPADYLAITSTYSTIFIDEVPVLLLKHKNEARRLINLVDAMCECWIGPNILADSRRGTLSGIHPCQYAPGWHVLSRCPRLA